MAGIRAAIDGLITLEEALAQAQRRGYAEPDPTMDLNGFDTKYKVAILANLAFDTYVDPADIYRAAVRVVMRLVVVLFAESRELLPRDNALYHGSYGLTGLLEELEKIAARGGNRLARSWNAWPRVLALFRLVHDGSHHPELLVPAYGG